MKLFNLIVAALVGTTLLAKDSTQTPATKQAPIKPRIEVAFVLDTTGSMGGLIEGAKQKIWSIANQMVSSKPAPDLRIGLVAYRDRGDEYVTRVSQLTNDIDAVYSTLQGFKANGGGDTPESVNEALDAAVRQLSWAQDKSVLKLIFLVGDAPPHMDYADGPKYPDICKLAMQKDILINTVQCGNMDITTPVWKEIASLSEGSYAAIAQSGNMQVVETPYDKDIAKLNREVQTTFAYYGTAREQSAASSKNSAVAAAPAAVLADRNSYAAKTGNIGVDKDDLIGAVNQGVVRLDKLEKDKLPTEFKNLSTEQIKAKVAEKQEQRDELQKKLTALDTKREAFIKEQRSKQSASAKSDSFDEKVAEIVTREAARKGLDYKAP